MSGPGTSEAAEAAKRREKERQGLQKIAVRIPLRGAEALDPDALLAVFGRWRLEEGEEIIDLADYVHVPDGPGVLLVSHRWHLGVDWFGGKPSFYFWNRKGLDGSDAERVRAVMLGALEKARRLLDEPEIPRGAQLDLGRFEIQVKDRIEAPNNDTSDRRFRPAVEAMLRALYGGEGFVLERERDPREPFGYRVEAVEATVPSLEEALRRLQA